MGLFIMLVVASYLVWTTMMYWLGRMTLVPGWSSLLITISAFGFAKMNLTRYILDKMSTSGKDRIIVITIALVIFKYFPHGGLQLDFRRIARECLARGHRVIVYTRSWEEERIPGAELRLIRASGLSNHALAQSFEKRAWEAIARDNPDVVMGFNRMRDLDIYFAADNCFAIENGTRAGWFRRLFSNRYRVYEAMERSVFAHGSKTRILYLTSRQREDFIRVYNTEPERLVLLPPGIETDRRRPEDEMTVAEIRKSVRSEFSIAQDELLLLQVCSGFATKGVDRTLKALASLPVTCQRVRMLVVGRENSTAFLKLARRLGVVSRVIFTGGRDDVGRLMLGADLMIHPARKEATGTVLVEALAAGLPVLTTANCGYENYVREAGSMVLPEPFDQAALNAALTVALEKLSMLREAAVAYGRQSDFYRRTALAVDQIEDVLR